ncbi:putative peptidyl prolyl cis-trans isomerase [Dipodascopsis tothii]|uniref:putative peptidyl prolyl cis-trans isomerase n=1 Tax=Dipodascopsis tothii TaxID=44089 RepID=UPI0034CEDF9B
MVSRRSKTTVHVSGLDSAVTAQVVHDAFIPFGDIVDVELPRDNKSRELHRGFAFVQYESAQDADAAIDNMDQAELYGRTLRVTSARSQNETFDIANAKTAVWEQEGWLQLHQVDEEDRKAVEEAAAAAAAAAAGDPVDAMARLDMAGPQQE